MFKTIISACKNWSRRVELNHLPADYELRARSNSLYLSKFCKLKILHGGVAIILFTLLAIPAHAIQDGQYLTDNIMQGIHKHDEFTTPPSVKSSWRWWNTGLEATWAALWITDWSQTLKIARNPNRYHENNLILGHHPHRDKINLYFASGLVGHFGISYYVLDGPYRILFQAGLIPYEATTVIHNNNIGLKASLSF